MTSIRHKLQNFIQNEWVAALLILGVFLATNGYTYGWDDQHLEIPLLKSLIDHTLYQGDYYIDTLQKNFTSFLYPLLAYVISIEQIPATFLILYLLSRYFLFYWIYKIWHYITKEKLTALLCALTIILVGRVEEFLYRTFSHQEFALAIIFAGIYYFYKERFFLAACILGAAANYHALYSLYPMIYMLVYLVCYRKKYGMDVLIKTTASFFIFALPLLFWTGIKFFNQMGTEHTAVPQAEWIALYKIACPQNFLFNFYSLKEVFGDLSTFLKATQEYWWLAALYLLNLFHNAEFRKDKKSQIIIITSFALFLVSFVFSYIFPSRFMLDLNMIRNSQYMLFILMSYTTILCVRITKNERWFMSLIIALIFPLIRFSNYITPLSAAMMMFILYFYRWFQKPRNHKRDIILGVFALCVLFSFIGIIKEFSRIRFNSVSILAMWLIFAALVTVYVLHFFLKSKKAEKFLRNSFILIPFILFTLNFSFYHYFRLKIENTGAGFWQMQRNWIDMQKYVKEHTEKNALILVPHDMEMGGFRIFSERKIVCSYRDCGVVGFDYQAAEEWQRRLEDIEPFQVFIKKPIAPAIINGILKYKVNYIVFMKYFEPGQNHMIEEMYSNQVFKLFKVKTNPVEEHPIALP